MRSFADPINRIHDPSRNRRMNVDNMICSCAKYSELLLAVADTLTVMHQRLSFTGSALSESSTKTAYVD